MKPTTKPRLALVRACFATLVAFALFATACGSDDPITIPDTATPAETAPVGSDPGSDPVEEVVERPQRIVSLSPSATETLFAIGAGEQVIAVDAFSNYPEGAPVTDLSGWDPNVEAILAFEPDLVVIANDANDLVAAMEAAGVDVHISAAPADIEAGYGAAADLGIAVGRVDETAAMVATMREEVAVAFASAPDASARIYHELDETFYSASSFGFIGAIYAEMGATNIADEADADGFGFPQLSEEYIVEADPQLIVITDQVTYTADDVAARPGWDQISAVQDGRVIVVNADIASRWGPRLPQFISVVAETLAGVPA